MHIIATLDRSMGVIGRWWWCSCSFAEAHGGNIYLMYVGYNSGPAVSNKVFKALKRRGDASLDDIGRHLEAGLQPYYGSQSAKRARSLLKTHLPKIAKAEARYRPKRP